MSKTVYQDKNKSLKINLENFYRYDELRQYGKIAYIESGTLTMNSVGNHFLYRHILEHVNIYESFENLRLEDFCAIVLPMGIDEVFLARFKDKILHYLGNGGVIMSFMSDYMCILPYSKGYIQSATPIRKREVKFSKSASAKIIFDGVREYDINYRRGVKGFFNRGYFQKDTLPKGAEMILEDSDGECVGYIDKVSTNGIIISTANADLLGFGLFDNTTARRMGVNLLHWLENEFKIKDYKALRDNATPFNTPLPKSVYSFLDFKANKNRQTLSSPRLDNAIITGGGAFHAHFFSNKNAKYADFFQYRCHFLDLSCIDFDDFDYIVIASRLNTNHLGAYKQKFLDYLNSGGHIVSFGEIDGDYLPNIIWKDYPVNFWWWLIDGADMPLYAIDSDGTKQSKRTKSGLFSTIDVNVAKWHCHGAFYPPKNATQILINELDEAIIYKDNSFKGNLYITSLDPDFHLGQGFMPTTEPFFDAFMKWVEQDIINTMQERQK